MDPEASRQETSAWRVISDQVPAGSSYLLVFEANSSWIFELPAEGEVLVGRGEKAGLRLDDTSVSRLHARLVVSGDQYILFDLGSQNGTFVEGERVSGGRNLVSGDSIGVGGVTLIFHGRAQRALLPLVLSFPDFRERIEQELERSARVPRLWSVLALHFGADVDRAEIARVVVPELRRVDVASWEGRSQLLVLLAETTVEGARAVAQRLLAALAGRGQARIGVAAYPVDGCDVDTLLASARSAARAEGSAPVISARDVFRTVEVGGRRLVIADPAMSRLFDLVRRLATTDMPVLIFGETGCGKELAATALHDWSSRNGRPFVALNCAAIPEQLVESELFGHERGAFSGAVSSKPGLIDTAAGGTLFLDEVTELPLPTQAKLLRVLETKRLLPVGAVREHDVDIRIVAASNHNLDEEVATGRFRKDLFFRLKGGTVWIPPLRDRKREIPVLAQAFLEEACAKAARAPMRISDPATHLLTTYAWPGNVRELQSLMSYVAVVGEGDVVEPRHLQDWLVHASAPHEGPAIRPREEGRDPGGKEPPGLRSIGDELHALERQRMLDALLATGGNQTRAAQLIGMPRRTFVAKMRAHRLRIGESPGDSEP